METTTTDEQHIKLMRIALDEAKKCEPMPTAFCVGCVITTSTGSILSTGYSRELTGNTHAEQNALMKLEREASSITSLDQALESDTRIYTTMEPCSERLSGNLPCVDRILALDRITEVYVGVREPSDFVECQGVKKLLDEGKHVITVVDEGLREECLRVARTGH